MDEIKPSHYITEDKCQEMIDDAIRRHNRNAGIISMFVGFFILGLFSEGLLRLIGVIDPIFPWLKITLQGKMQEDEKREFYKGLRERIKQLRMQHLFEEPCPLYEEDDYAED